MAKIEVKMTFVDKHTKQVHPAGEVFEASEERISEIRSISPDLIQVIPEADPVTEAPKRKRKKDGE